MKRKQEHVDTCKSIVNELTAIKEERLYVCPMCEHEFELDVDGCFVDEKCPECGHSIHADDLVGFFDYFEDALDIQYMVNASDIKDGRITAISGVRVMVACGGPNIYINTSRCLVELFWWDECGDAWLPREVCDAIDEHFEMWALM